MPAREPPPLGLSPKLYALVKLAAHRLTTVIVFSSVTRIYTLWDSFCTSPLPVYGILKREYISPLIPWLSPLCSFVDLSTGTKVNKSHLRDGEEPRDEAREYALATV